MYDGNGNRYSKTVNGQVRYYAYDTSGNIVNEYKQLTTNNEQRVLVRYVRDTGGKAISMIQGANTYYFVFNGHGDVTTLTDASGAVVATYSYDEFGNITSPDNEIYNPIRYSGAHNAYYDSETALYKMGTRYYQPDISRWLTRDIDKGEKTQPALFNKYAYSLNNPVTNVDPTGNRPVAPRKHKKRVHFWRGAKDNRVLDITMHKLNLRFIWAYDGRRVISSTHKSWTSKKPWWKIVWFGPDSEGSNWARTSASFGWTGPAGAYYQNTFVIKITGHADGRWNPGGYEYIDTNPYGWYSFNDFKVRQIY